MAHQGEGMQSSAHIINVQKAIAAGAEDLREFRTPIRDSIDFHGKFAALQRREYLKLDEVERLRVVFEHFAVDNGQEKYWTESSFARFLVNLLPNSSFSPIHVTTIMYRLFRHLGSYPYHLYPQIDYLTFDQMTLAIQILLHRVKSSEVSQGGVTSHTMSRPNTWRLVFQSLAAASTTKVSAAHPGPSGLNPDNWDILVVHTMLTNANTRGIKDPTSQNIISGAPVPLIQRFVPSFSRALDGRLPEAELLSLLQLVVSTYGQSMNADVDREAYIILGHIRGWEAQIRNQHLPSDGAIGYQALCQALFQHGLQDVFFPALERVFSPCLKQEWVHTMKWLDQL